MLKPWIVQTLLWIFKTGLVVGPIFLVWLRWFWQPASRSRGVAAVAFLWLTVTLTGWSVGFVVTTITYTILCAFFFGVLTFIDRNRPATLLILVPLTAGVGFMAWVYRNVVADSDNPLVPFYEQRLNEQLICRGYPKWNDSVPATRLMLVRRTNGLEDQMLGYIDGYYRTDCISCSVLPDGRVRLNLMACDGTWKVDKEVKLNATAATVTGNRH